MPHGPTPPPSQPPPKTVRTGLVHTPGAGALCRSPRCCIVHRACACGGWHEAMVLVCLPLAAPIGLLPLNLLTLCGPERVLVVSTEPPDDLSCLTTPGVGRPGDGAVARAVDQGHPDAPSESIGGLPTPALTWGGGGGGFKWTAAGHSSPPLRPCGPAGWRLPGPCGSGTPSFPDALGRTRCVERV